jgi:hypothetical protein
MTIKHIQTIGHFLANYKSDLNYISKFHSNKLHGFSVEDYIKKAEGTFYKFLIEFKVIRNIKKDKASDVLNLTKEWIESTEANNVDGFATELKRLALTQDKKVMTSLASKILFLNNPYEIFPLDNRAKNSLGHKSNNYSGFLTLVQNFAIGNGGLISQCLSVVENLYPIIEADYIETLPNIEIIRKNRFTDKLLWIGLKERAKRSKKASSRHGISAI